MTGQAETAPASGGLEELASLLSDTPEKEPEDKVEEIAAESTDELDTDLEATDGQDEPGDEPEENAEPAPVNITFKVKTEDGTEETVELKPEDLPGAFMRQKDYTVKTQALAKRESDAVQFMQQKHEEMRGHYMQQAEVTRAAILQLAGIKSDSEMAQLAQTDPAGWVAENQRRQTIGNYLSQVDQSISSEKQKSTEEAQKSREKQQSDMFQRAWGELSKDGIDRPALQKIFTDSSKSYGFEAAEFNQLYDPRMVRVLRDATAYRELQSKKAEVTKKLTEAPRLPTRQSQPAQERKDKAIEARFSSGRAKLSDLASFLN